MVELELLKEGNLAWWISEYPREVNNCLLRELELLHDISDQMHQNKHALLSNSGFNYIDDLASLCEKIKDLLSTEELTHTKLGIDYLHSLEFNAQFLIESTWSISKQQWRNMLTKPADFLIINIERGWRRTSHYDGKTINFRIEQDDAYANGYVRIPFDEPEEWFYFDKRMRPTPKLFVHKDKDDMLKDLILGDYAEWIEETIVNADEDDHFDYVKDNIRIIINGGE